MNAQWRFAVSVGGFWLCSGRLDKKNSKIFFSWHVGAGFLSVTSGLVFVTFYISRYNSRSLARRALRDTRSPNPLSFFVVSRFNVPNERHQFLPVL